MKTDLSPYIEKEINFIINKLIKLGNYKLEDGSFLYRTCTFEVNNISPNKDWQNQFSLCLFPKLLSFGGRTEVWINCRIELSADKIKSYKDTFDFYNSEVIKNIKEVILEDFKKINLVPFMDEDSFMNYFTKPETNNGFVKLSFYVNTSYPKGCWENHTLN
jgi:hypothetical protein